MPIVISIPDECKALADAVTDLVTSVTRARRRADGGRAVDYAQVERELGDRTAAVERAAHRDILATLDVDAPAVVIDGRVHTRVHRAEGRYYTLAGDVVVDRALYRAERNGPVVDAITLRTGALAGGWLPETATAMAHLLQQGTAREAEATGQRLGRVAYSHSSFERVGQAVGQQYAERKTAIDDALIVALDVPAATQSVSFGIDRVSLPLEEPRPRPVGRPRTDAPKRPVQRVFRMAYCTTVTFHDATGEALHTIRQGAIPSIDPVDLCDRLLADAVAILEQRPDLRVVLLSDGAPEMRTLLRSALDASTLGTAVYELLDFWHVLEKLAPAAQVVYRRGAGAGGPRAMAPRSPQPEGRRGQHPRRLDGVRDAPGAGRNRASGARGDHLPSEPSRAPGLPGRAAPRSAHRERQHGGDVQDVVHRADEAEWRALEGSHRRPRDQPPGVGAQ